MRYESWVREWGARVGGASMGCESGRYESGAVVECKSGARVSVRKRGGRAGCENTV